MSSHTGLVSGETKLEYSTYFLCCLALISLFGGGIYGYNVASSAYLSQLKEEYNITTGGSELVSSAATVSDAASMLIVGTLFLDQWGRRNTVALGAVFNVVGCLVGSISRHFVGLVIGRFIQGVGNGVSILAVPMLVSESSKREHRGYLVTFFQIGIVCGFTLPYVVQLASHDWQTTVALGAIPGAGLLAVLLSVWSKAESKSWLASQRTDNVPLVVDEAESEYDDLYDEEDLVDMLEGSVSNEERVSRSSSGKSFLVSSLLAVVLAFTNNSSDAIVFYGPQIMQNAGIGSEESLWTALYVSLINIPAAIAVLAVIHRFTRRTLLLCGLAVIIACYFSIGVLFLSNMHHSTYAIIALFFLLMVAFQAGPGTLFIVVLPELFEQSSRAQGMAVGTAAMSVFSILCNGTMLSTVDALGGGVTFFLYGSLYVVCFAILWRHLPESKHVQIVH